LGDKVNLKESKMYTQIIESLKNKPNPYVTTDVAFWDDEYISQSMLNAHLEPDKDGASRNHEHIIKSVDWIAGFIQKDKNALLDLGCGPGIYAALLCDKGFQVTGIDYSKSSISYAKQSAAMKNKSIDYLYQNYLTIDYKAEYDIVTLIYCDFGVLPPQERLVLLNKIFNVLKPGGIFIVDVFTLTNYSGFQENTVVAYEDKGFWRPEPYVCIQRNVEYKHMDYLEQYMIITENQCQTYNLWNHAFSPNELISLMKQAGFDHIDLYADVTGIAFRQNSKTMCAVCKKI